MVRCTLQALQAKHIKEKSIIVLLQARASSGLVNYQELGLRQISVNDALCPLALALEGTCINRKRFELELELTHTHMAHKPMLRTEVYALV